MINEKFTALPFLVPQVDADGNELAGIRVPEVSVPLATTTGWNFRAERIGNPTTIVALLGSYVPFARTRAERDARHDPRPSIEERYTGATTTCSGFVPLRRRSSKIDYARAGRRRRGPARDEALGRTRPRDADELTFVGATHAPPCSRRLISSY